MAEFTSHYFGTLTYSEDAVLDFPAGLPGFAGEKRFLLVEQPVNKPLIFMQSLSRPDLCFITLNIRDVFPEYAPAIAAEDLRALGLAEDRQPVDCPDTQFLGIVSIEADKPPRINLLAPVVVNWSNRRAVQAIQTDSDYSHEHPLDGTPAAGPCS